MKLLVAASTLMVLSAALVAAQQKLTMPEHLILSEIEPAKGVTTTRILVKLASENADNIFKVVVQGAGYVYAEALRVDPDSGTLTRCGAARMNGAEHVYMTERPCITFNHYIFDSDVTFPLTFKMQTGQGYVYLCGRGNVSSKDGSSTRIGYSTTLDQWIYALRSGDDLMREGAAQALGWIGTPKCVPDLLSALRDKRMEVRRNAAEALGRIVYKTDYEKKAGLDALAAAAKDESQWVTSVAREAEEKLKAGTAPREESRGFEVFSQSPKPDAPVR